jgi:LEA14-like dessication related protein
MKRLLVSVLASLVLVGLWTGCTSRQEGLVGLQFELAGIERTAAGAQATFRVVNPNMVSYNLDNVTYTVALDGKVVGTAQVKQPTGVPAQQTVALTAALVLAPGAVLPTGEAAYRLDAQVLFRLYDEVTEKLKVASAGRVVVK